MRATSRPVFCLVQYIFISARKQWQSACAPILRIRTGLLGCVDIYRKQTIVPTRQMNEVNRSASFS